MNYCLLFVHIYHCINGNISVVYFQLSEFEGALKQRDEVIKQLTSNLQATTEGRDSMQKEYIAQAQQLAQQVQTLQLQLQQVGTDKRVSV